VIHSDRYGGFWFVSGFDDVREVLTDCETFTATEGVILPSQNMPMLPGESDPPLHTAYRKLLSPPLAPQVIKEHEGWIRDLAREWLEPLRGEVEFDACTRYCEPFAKRIAMRVIGYEAEDLDKLDHWTEVLATGTREDAEGVAVSMEFFEHMRTTLESRAAQPPRADIISLIASGEVEGRPLRMEEKLSLLLQITFGGLHTTGAVIAGALVWLAGHPEDRLRLRDQPELVRSATEEFIRHVTPVPHSIRTAAVDTTVHECPIKAGDKVMFGLGAANYDERVFDNPDDVVLDRFPNRHVGFGAGPHRCVGSHLGKLGVRIGIEEFIAAFPEFEIPDYYALRWTCGEGRGLTTVPLRVSRR
jgi:cytochrome P450